MQQNTRNTSVNSLDPSVKGSQQTHIGLPHMGKLIEHVPSKDSLRVKKPPIEQLQIAKRKANRIVWCAQQSNQSAQAKARREAAYAIPSLREKMEHAFQETAAQLTKEQKQWEAEHVKSGQQSLETLTGVFQKQHKILVWVVEEMVLTVQPRAKATALGHSGPRRLGSLKGS